MKRTLLAAAAIAVLATGFSGPAGAADSPGVPGRASAGDQWMMDTLLADAAAPAGATTESLDMPSLGPWGFDATGMDRTVNPGDDFNRFVNGAWLDRTQIPSDRVRYGSFDVLRILSAARVHAIVEDAAAGRIRDDKDAAKYGRVYTAFMNEALAEKLDAKPIQAELAAIRAARTRDDIAALMGKANVTGYTAVFGLGISTDLKSPTQYAVYAGTGGLGLPDRDYYLKPEYADKKAAYEVYIARMLTLAGWPEPEAQAKAIVAYESRLAEVQWSRIERRDRDKLYNPATLAELKAQTPGFAWDRYMDNDGLKGETRFIVTTNTAFPKVAAIYADTPVATLQAWQAFHVVNGAAPYLSKRFADAEYEFNDKTLSGQPEQEPRWKRGVSLTNDIMGEAVGRTYVARYFPASSKATMIGLVGDIQSALKTRIENLPWMTPETKAKALEKLSKFTVKIGYPDTWRDYSPLVTKDDDLYGNIHRSAAYEWNREVARLHKPVDKTEWGMTPQTVNAYYNGSNNEIVFPAAILQPPFFDPKADMAINYGGIGGVIGHEISHGFDDQGRKSDGDGVLRDWWTAEDTAKFNTQRDRLGAQYSAFEPIPGSHVQGGLTMGENIGDMGGLSLGLDAYHVSLKGKPAPVIDGFTGDQRVFMGWAQVWRDKIRDEALKQRLATDPHSPARYRINGTIRNIDGWYAAWGVKPTDKLYVAPEDRVRIW